MKWILLTVLSMAFFDCVVAQKTTSTTQQIWGGYFNQTRFSKRWGLWAEAQLRTKEDFISDFSLGFVRAGATYYLNNATKLTVGYGYFNHFPTDAHPDISQPEHRPWQQVQWHTNYPKLRLMQWVRLEERFRRKIKDNDALADGYNFNYRARYNIFLSFPLSKKAFEPGTFSLGLNEEVHINFGEEVVYNSFDQNRLFVGFNYHVNRHDQLQFGYMNLFQQLGSGNHYRTVHAARIGYFHNLDLRKKSQNPVTP